MANINVTQKSDYAAVYEFGSTTVNVFPDFYESKTKEEIAAVIESIKLIYFQNGSLENIEE